MGTAKRERQKANRAQKVASQVVQEKQDQRKRTFVGLAIVVVAVVVIGGLLYASQGSKSKKSATVVTTTSVATSTSVAPLKQTKFAFGTTVCPPADGSATRTLTFKAPPENCLTAGKTYTATFDTSAGSVVVALDTTKTPGTANNFVFLARNKYYDGTTIFRANTGIDILQGGSPHSEDGSDTGPGYALQDEGKFDAQATRGNYTYAPGDLAMARSQGPNSASAQFFFVTGPNGKNLDASGTYVVFGHVTQGLDILQKMVSTAKITDASSQDGTPNPAVTIKTVTISSN